jgi:protein TonB
MPLASVRAFPVAFGLMYPVFLLKNAGGVPIDLKIRHIFIRLPMKLILRIFITLILTVGCCRLCYAQDAEGVYTKVDEKPIPLKTPRPEFPDSLKNEGISGIVAISCIIDETGKVISALATKSTRSEFEKPALDAIQNWKFKPARKDGKPVKVRVVIPFHFNLE